MREIVGNVGSTSLTLSVKNIRTQTPINNIIIKDLVANVCVEPNIASITHNNGYDKYHPLSVYASSHANKAFQVSNKEKLKIADKKNITKTNCLVSVLIKYHLNIKTSHKITKHKKNGNVHTSPNTKYAQVLKNSNKGDSCARKYAKK